MVLTGFNQLVLVTLFIHAQQEQSSRATPPHPIDLRTLPTSMGDGRARRTQRASANNKAKGKQGQTTLQRASNTAKGKQPSKGQTINKGHATKILCMAWAKAGLGAQHFVLYPLDPHPTPPNRPKNPPNLDGGWNGQANTKGKRKQQSKGQTRADNIAKSTQQSKGQTTKQRAHKKGKGQTTKKRQPTGVVCKRARVSRQQSSGNQRGLCVGSRVGRCA